MIELQFLRMAGLEAARVAMLQHGDREGRVAGEGLLGNLEPGFDRPGEPVGAADAERAHVIQEEVGPMLGREQHQRIGPTRMELRLDGFEPARDGGESLRASGFRPSGGARGVAHGCGENDAHSPPRIAVR